MNKISDKGTPASVSNAAKILITQETTVNGVTANDVQQANIEQIVAALRANGINADYVTETAMGTALESIVSSIQETDGGIIVTYGNGDTLPISIESGGLAFDGGYVDEDNKLHLTENGEDIEGFDPITLPATGGGSGGGGSRLTFSCYTGSYFSVIESAGHAVITYKFASIDTETEIATGSGTLTISVGGVVKNNTVIAQGDNLTVDVFPYLVTGTNTVRLMITDGYGATATRTFTIVVESFGIAWSLNDVQMNTEGNLEFTYTPTGNGSKTIYTYVDGVLYSTDTVTTSGRRATKTISGLSHGAHAIEVYGTMVASGSTLESNHLRAAVAQVVGGNNTPIVAANWPSGQLTQFTAVSIPYMVYDPAGTPSTAALKEGQTTVNTLSVDRTAHVWAYRPTVSGSVTVSIVCGVTTASHTYTVNGLQISAEEITDGLVCKVDPSTISNLATWSNNGYSFTLSQGFDLVNGGLMTDADGVHCIRITAGDRLTLSYDPFSTNPTVTGREIKIIYRIANSASKTAVGISCMSNNRGLKVQANNAYLYGNQNSVELSLCEDRKTELDVTIQQKTNNSDQLMMLWERCSTFAIKQYASDENFAHSSSVGITFGSDDADVYLYLFRAYSRDLTTTEIKNNYIVDGPDGSEIHDRDTRNDIYDGNGVVNFDLAAQANPDCHFILLNAEKISTAKKKNGGTVEGTMRHVYVAGGAQHTFTANIKMDLQGTSSEEHALTAGPNLNLRIQNGITLDDGTHLDGYAMHGSANSIAVNLFNYKKNVASQDHIVNRMCAEWYNRFQPSVRSARTADPRVRDCLECTMCAIFFHNTGSSAVQVGPDLVQPNETIFFGLGNLCSSKDCYETFEYDDIVIEVLNNTEPQVRFKSTDLTGNNWKNNYEFRYLNEDEYTEAQAKAEWQTVQNFIYATDYTAATDESLASPVTIGGVTYNTDSAAYRKAKWTAEAPTIFDMDTLYWHHIITLFFLLRDNRAKNMFWSKSKDSGKWGLWFNWDNDTGLCRNNRGYVDMEPGYMDWDTLGTSDVFNAADNALFTNLRECNFAQLRAMYVDREAAGAWDINDLFEYCQESQEQICESLWIEDAEHNAIRILENMGNTNYLERATGKLQLHVLKTLTFQKALVDSYFTAADSTTDRARLRGNTPSEWAGVQPSGVITITPYTNMYINILAGATSYRQRAYEGVPITFNVTASLNDTEMYLYSAEWIQGLGDLSALYLSQFEIGTMKRVREVLLGSNVSGYYNSSAMTLSFANCVKLETLNLAGLTGAALSLDFSNNIYLKTIDTRGSALTGLRFAKNGRLTTAQLNALVSLYMSGLRDLATFSMAAYTNLEVLTVENCGVINTKNVVSGASALENLRLLGISWTLDSTSLLDRIYNLGGLDDAGLPSLKAVLTGTVHVPVMRQRNLDNYNSAWPNLTVNYDTMTEQYTVHFLNADGSAIKDLQGHDYVQYVDRGSTPYDPIQAGEVQTPTKASDAQYNYTFSAWTGIYDPVLANKNITAAYSTETRTYTVRWYSQPGTLLKQLTGVAYGSCVQYNDQDIYDFPELTNEEDSYVYKVFMGWDKSTGFIKENTDVYAVWDRAALPTAGAVDLEDMSIAQIAGIAKNKACDTFFSAYDHTDIQVGRDYSFSNVQSQVLVATPTYFDGTSANVITTAIKLFDANAPSFTLAIDFEFTGGDTNACLLSCYDENGNEGFRLRYSSHPNVQWGDVNVNVGYTYIRSILTLRHQKGSNNLYVGYQNVGNGIYAGQVVEAVLARTRSTSTDAVLTIGGITYGDGTHDYMAEGWVHWAKIWYEDLGAPDTKAMAAWPHEVWRVHYDTLQKRLAGNTAEKAAGEFIFNAPLPQCKRMNATSTNAGGWDQSELRPFINGQVFDALPVCWQSLIRTVKVNASEGSQSTVITVSEDKMYLLALAECTTQTDATYLEEATGQIPFFTNNASRIKFPGFTLADDTEFITNAQDPTLFQEYTVQHGKTVWINTSNSSSGYLYVDAEFCSKHKWAANRLLSSSDNLDAQGAQGGKWLLARYWWLRSPYLSNSTAFYTVASGGSGAHANGATNTNALVCGFSI